MALAGFAPIASGTVSLSVGTASAQVALNMTGPPPTGLVTNIGEQTAFVVLGTSSAVVATVATGIAIPPKTSLPLTVTGFTNLAAICLEGETALNITTGT